MRMLAVSGNHQNFQNGSVINQLTWRWKGGGVLGVTVNSVDVWQWWCPVLCTHCSLIVSLQKHAPLKRYICTQSIAVPLSHIISYTPTPNNPLSHCCPASSADAHTQSQIIIIWEPFFSRMFSFWSLSTCRKEGYGTFLDWLWRCTILLRLHVGIG